MISLLASVRTVDEAAIALEGGADILDLKEPASGALGRLPEPAIVAIRAAVAGRRPLSATIGDLPLDPEPVAAAVARMAATGVDIVKIGMFEGAPGPTLDALAPIGRAGHRLVAVLFADRQPDFALIERAAAAGFHGVMLDTADKAAGPLTRHLPVAALADFVARARREGLLVGLAGSLGVTDVPALAPLGPDYLGFRSALTMGARDRRIDPAAVARVRAALDATGRADPRADFDQLPARSSATAAAGAPSAARSATGSLAGTSAA